MQKTRPEIGRVNRPLVKNLNEIASAIATYQDMMNIFLPGVNVIKLFADVSYELS